MTGLATVLLLAIPFIPGLRDIPRWIPVHRLIWRNWNQQSAGPEPAAQPATRAQARTRRAEVGTDRILRRPAWPGCNREPTSRAFLTLGAAARRFNQVGWTAVGCHVTGIWNVGVLLAEGAGYGQAKIRRTPGREGVCRHA